ncbi:MAG TPA: methionine synthase, partial [Chitinophagaceae bacterium]|nr:methionine synthase [Chitinophagaceae bacterium]
FEPVKPAFIGVKVIQPDDLQEIAAYIDWQPFFIAWEMHGKFPDLLTDEKIGEAASRLFKDAQALLKKIIHEKWLTPRGTIGIWPANRTADDTVT